MIEVKYEANFEIIKAPSSKQQPQKKLSVVDMRKFEEEVKDGLNQPNSLMPRERKRVKLRRSDALIVEE